MRKFIRSNPSWKKTAASMSLACDRMAAELAGLKKKNAELEAENAVLQSEKNTYGMENEMLRRAADYYRREIKECRKG